MKIKNEFPPNIKEIKKHFNIPKKNVVFTYGDTLYVPDGGNIDPFLMRHEKTHSKQQGDNPKAWWDRYLVDVDFRLSQEVEAYQRQYQSAKSNIKDKNQLNKFLHSIAGDLSGEIYGNMISFQEALQAIQSQKLFKFRV